MSRQLKFKDPKELKAKINLYFENCRKLNRPFTLTGLALDLDISRKRLMDYKDRQDFEDIITEAVLRCENYAEEQLFIVKNPAGIIFNMVNNYGWLNKYESRQVYEDVTPANLEGLTTDQLKSKALALVKGGS